MTLLILIPYTMTASLTVFICARLGAVASGRGSKSSDVFFSFFATCAVATGAPSSNSGIDNALSTSSLSFLLRGARSALGLSTAPPDFADLIYSLSSFSAPGVISSSLFLF